MSESPIAEAERIAWKRYGEVETGRALIKGYQASRRRLRRTYVVGRDTGLTLLVGSDVPYMVQDAWAIDPDGTVTYLGAVL